MKPTLSRRLRLVTNESLVRRERGARPNPSNDESIRPGPIAPERCVTTQEMITSQHVQLIGRDLSGTIRVIVQLERDEEGVTWFERVIRRYLAWRYGACDITSTRGLDRGGLRLFESAQRTETSL